MPATISVGYRPECSHSLATGRISLLTKLRIDSWKLFWASFNWKSMTWRDPFRSGLCGQVPGRLRIAPAVVESSLRELPAPFAAARVGDELVHGDDVQIG